MSERPLGGKRLQLSPVHLVRANRGLDGIRVVANGFGWVVGSFGVQRVRGVLDVVRFARFRHDRCWSLFFGLHGVTFAATSLRPPGRAAVPVIDDPRLPPPPAVVAPCLELQLTITPPELP